MDELVVLLEGIKSGVNYWECENLITGGVFGSFEIIQVIPEIEGKFGVSIMPDDITPQNFNSAKSMWNMIIRLKKNV